MAINNEHIIEALSASSNLISILGGLFFYRFRLALVSLESNINQRIENLRFEVYTTFRKVTDEENKRRR